MAHYLGSFIIILGVLVVKLPDLLHGGGGEGGGGDVFIFNLLFLLSNVVSLDHLFLGTPGRGCMLIQPAGVFPSQSRPQRVSRIWLIPPSL